MRLCVPVPCFFKYDSAKTFADALKQIGALGYDAAETYNWKPLTDDPQLIVEAQKEAKVELLSMCTTEFRMTDPTYRKEWLAGLKESCEFAKKIGVRKLISQVGPDTGASRAEQHKAIVDTLNLAKPILEDYDVTLMPEPLNTYVNHPGYYLWSAVEGFEIIREVDHKNVKLIYDIYHQQIMEGNIIPNVTNNLDCIAHLHGAGHPGRHEMQFGESDYKVIFAAIDKAGYTGACGLEYNPTMDPIESLKIAKEIYG